MNIPAKEQTTITIPLKRILLVDDSPRDTELALDALAQHNLANETRSSPSATASKRSTTCIGAARSPTEPPPGSVRSLRPRTA
jgi:hypothetical protein